MRNRLLVLLILCIIAVFPGCSDKASDEASNTTEVQSNDEQKGNVQQKTDTSASTSTGSESNDFLASLPLLPSLVDSPEKGYYVDLLKAIDDAYTEGNMKIEVNPIARAQQMVAEKQADFYLPKIATKYTDHEKLPYVLASKSLGHISYVLYSNVNKKLTKEDLDKALEKGGDFPYKLESSPGLKESFKYPYTVSNNIEESVKKLDAGRIDGYIWSQEEVDAYLNKEKLKNIYRSLFYEFDDDIAIAKNDKSEKINKILTDCIGKLESSGKLKELYDKIHSPYKEWQPSNMGW